MMLLKNFKKERVKKLVKREKGKCYEKVCERRDFMGKGFLITYIVKKLILNTKPKNKKLFTHKNRAIILLTVSGSLMTSTISGPGDGTIPMRVFSCMT